MRKQLAVSIVAALCLASCRSVQRTRAEELAQVAKDWCLTIRASQVLPVYPLTEDLQVGDIFLVSTPLEEEIRVYESEGFLPLDNVVARIKPTGWSDFYGSAYAVKNDSVLPRDWQFPQPTPSAPPLTAWGTAPGAAFPSYTFQVKKGFGANLAIPIQSVPVGLSILRTGDASGTVNIAGASTYGLPITVLSPQVDDWARANRDFLRTYAPHTTTNAKGKPIEEQNYLRVVYRVYVAGGVSVSLVSNEASGGRVDAGASKPIAIPDAGEAADAAKALQGIQSNISQSVASTTPGANVTVAMASSRSVAMNETFPRPLVIGYLAFDRPIREDGSLGPPMSTQARVEQRTVSSGTAVFGADDNTAKLRTWLDADPGNRQKLRDFLAAHAPGVAVATFLNGEQFRQLRASAVTTLGVQ